MNIGILGYGKMGQLRHAVLNRMGGHRVVQVYDPAPVQGDFCTTDDPNQVIHNDALDAVMVCTPNHVTCDLVVRALKAGRHVFAEKPPGTSVAQVRQMMAAQAQAAGCTLMFGFNHRYHASVMEARRRITSGAFGNILWMRGRYGKSVDESFFQDWRARRRLAGGGILMDQGIHMLDLLMYFAGGFDEVKSFCSNLYWKLDVEDNVFALLKNNTSQVVASLHSTMTQWRHLFSLEIFLERGYITINGIITSSMTYATTWGKEVLTIATGRSAPPQARHGREERLVYDDDDSWQTELNEFFAAATENRPPLQGNLDDSLQLMQLIEKIYHNGNQAGA